MRSKRPDEKLTIGEWVADPALNALRRGAEIVRIEPKAMDVLMLLAARAGAVVTREELFASAWPGVVVGDEALSQSIAKLRRALGDDPRAPRYIETIAKRGYRLVAARPEARRAHARWVIAAAGALALAAGGAFFALDRPELPDSPRASRAHTRSADAGALFAQARALFLARGSRENREARALYLRALEIDPTFARAYAGLAMSYAIEHRVGGSAEGSRSLDRALELAHTAELIDPDIAEVHWALGFVHAQARRHEQAIASLARAIELDPSFADAYALLGGIHTYLGEPRKTIPLLRTALRLNPDGGYLYFLLLGRAYLLDNDAEQALINLRQAAVRNPADLETHIYLAAALAMSGDEAGAAWEREEIRTLERGFSLRRWLDSYPLRSGEDRQKLQAMLGKAGFGSS